MNKIQKKINTSLINMSYNMSGTLVSGLLIFLVVAISKMCGTTTSVQNTNTPAIDTTSAIVMVESNDGYNYDSLNNILDWYAAMMPGFTPGYYYEFHQEFPMYHKLVNTDMNINYKELYTKLYIFQYRELAKTISHKYHIPTSVVLGQAILESGSGLSMLAAKGNNHFGVKCFSKTCKQGHCVNANDDHHKDFFRVYDNVWQSYEDYGKFLSKPRYRHLKDYGNDYKSWLHGLSKAGYATDKGYATKVIGIIQKHKLYKYDN